MSEVEALSFGNPANPFNEDPWKLQAHIERKGDVRNVARGIINFMTSFPERVDMQLVDGGLERSFAFDCSAPLDVNRNIFFNGSVQSLVPPTFVPVQIRIGDLWVDGDVTKRWARLTRPELAPFGIGGISQRLTGYTAYDEWRAVTTVIQPDAKGAETLIFAHQGEDLTQDPDPIPMTNGRHCGNHLISLEVALDRSLEKQLKIQAGKA